MTRRRWTDERRAAYDAGYRSHAARASRTGRAPFTPPRSLWEIWGQDDAEVWSAFIAGWNACQRADDDEVEAFYRDRTFPKPWEG